MWTACPKRSQTSEAGEPSWSSAFSSSCQIDTGEALCILYPNLQWFYKQKVWHNSMPKAMKFNNLFFNPLIMEDFLKSTFISKTPHYSESYLPYSWGTHNFLGEYQTLPALPLSETLLQWAIPSISYQAFLIGYHITPPSSPLSMKLYL